MLTQAQELTVRKRPFEGLNEVRVIMAISRGETPKIPFRHGVDLGLRRALVQNICRQCWSLDPALRPEMHSILLDLTGSKSSRNPTRLHVPTRTVNLPEAMEAELRKRLIHDLALGAATLPDLLKRVGGIEADLDTRTRILQLIREVWFCYSDKQD